jgi:hypothetical protein
MIVSFRGRGQTTFNMSDGTSVWFTGDIDYSCPVVYNPECEIFEPVCDDFSKCAGGTHAFVLMDQTKDDIAKGKNKVVFQRDCPCPCPDPCNDNTCQRILIGIGPNSILTYLSTNLSGLDDECDPCSYGAIAFDPTNCGPGRMIIYIRGAYEIDWDPGTTAPNPTYGRIIEKYPFNDGALTIAGHYVYGFEPGIISGCDPEMGGYPGYDFTKPAGVKAVMRVVDNKNYNAATRQPVYDPSPLDRRGPIIINDVHNHGKHASDPYLDILGDVGPEDDFWGVWWAYSMPQYISQYVPYPYFVRPGCVIGANGMVDVYHNTFLHHVSGSVNEIDPTALWDYGYPGGPTGYGFLSILKKRNPSALIIDGLNPMLFSYGNPFILDGAGDSTPSSFVAANPWTQPYHTRGEVMFRGDGTLYLTSAASQPYGYLWSLWNDESWQSSTPWWDNYLYPWQDPNLDWTRAIWVGRGWYDGHSVLPDPYYTNHAMPRYSEGNHVLDVEGPLKVWSVPNNSAWNTCHTAPRTYATVVDDAGTLEMATLLLNHQGRETHWADGAADLVRRPLLRGVPGSSSPRPYACYNSPTMFFNNMAGFYDSILAHTDVTKFVNGIPRWSEPAITGGERLIFSQYLWSNVILPFDPDRYRHPEVRFFNSEFQLQESCNASGVRFVVRDIWGAPDRDGDNTSVFRFYDHGDRLDSRLTGYGRILQLGSNLNLMGDALSQSVRFWLTTSIQAMPPKVASLMFTDVTCFQQQIL